MPEEKRPRKGLGGRRTGLRSHPDQRGPHPLLAKVRPRHLRVGPQNPGQPTPPFPAKPRPQQHPAPQVEGAWRDHKGLLHRLGEGEPVPHEALVGLALARVAGLQLGDGPLHAAPDKPALLAIGAVEKGVKLNVLKPIPSESQLLGDGGEADEDVGAAPQVKAKALVIYGGNRPSGHLPPLKDPHPVARLGQVGRRHQGVVPCAHHGHIQIRHTRASYATRAQTPLSHKARGRSRTLS
ncbi:hypothetical protein Mlute_01797 [Meiothermus luteus]|uniref:Uncharacterized protein n=1 Tax=Meiothermus luteus TaxID=2026184 RepID=A0A399EJ57_9DEIN|nr:hypothetical protein Mlute_01797 [Meiothermus luteus]